MNYKMLTKQKTIKYFLYSLLVLILFGCERKMVPDEYVARVGDVYLTENMIAEYLNSEKYDNIYREELIRQWVDKELLYQQAVDEGITEDEEFLSIMNDSEKELAGNLLYEKHLSEFNIGSDSAEIVQYYNSNSEQFNLVEDAFIVNCIKFSEKRIASKFKSDVVKNKWAHILENYNQSDLVIEDCFNKLYYKSQLKSKSYYDKIKRMNIGTVVSFVESEPEEFVIIQLVDKYVANTIPKIEYLFDEIREHMIATKQKSIYNNLINKLYSDYNVEIKR